MTQYILKYKYSPVYLYEDSFSPVLTRIYGAVVVQYDIFK